MKKLSRILLLILALSLATSVQALDLSKMKIKKPGSSGTSATTSNPPATNGTIVVSNEPTEQDKIYRDLNRFVGNPAKEALSYIRNKYGREKGFSMSIYTWDIKSKDQPGKCFELSLKSTGPNVDSISTYLHDC